MAHALAAIRCTAPSRYVGCEVRCDSWERSATMRVGARNGSNNPGDTALWEVNLMSVRPVAYRP